MYASPMTPTGAGIAHTLSACSSPPSLSRQHRAAPQQLVVQRRGLVVRVQRIHAGQDTRTGQAARTP